MGSIERSEERQVRQLQQLINPGWVTAFITILMVVVGMAVSWGQFAKREYVDTKVESVQKMQTENYIDLLNKMNEIKVILQDKQNRSEKR